MEPYIYGIDRVSYVPLQYKECRQINVMGEIYTSEKSRSERSSAILAAWPSVSGVLLRTPHEDDLRVGIVQFFILHTPHIRKDIVVNATALTNVELLKEPHILAKVSWLQDHPRKLMKYKNGIIMAATVYDMPSSAQYIPVSRIISHCGVIERTVQLDYGEDKVIFAIPIRRPL